MAEVATLHGHDEMLRRVSSLSLVLCMANPIRIVNVMRAMSDHPIHIEVEWWFDSIAMRLTRCAAEKANLRAHDIVSSQAKLSCILYGHPSFP